MTTKRDTKEIKLRRSSQAKQKMLMININKITIIVGDKLMFSSRQKW